MGWPRQPFGAKITSSKPKPGLIELVLWDILLTYIRSSNIFWQRNIEQALATPPVNQISHGNDPGGPTVTLHITGKQNLPQTRAGNTNQDASRPFSATIKSPRSHHRRDHFVDARRIPAQDVDGQRDKPTEAEQLQTDEEPEATSHISSPLSTVPSAEQPLDFPASDTSMATPSDNEFPNAVSAPPGWTTRCRGVVPVKPAKKKPGPKAKEKESSDIESIEEERLKPVNKKPGPKPNPKLRFLWIRVNSFAASGTICVKLAVDWIPREFSNFTVSRVGQEDKKELRTKDACRRSDRACDVIAAT
ncbi:hypothetical protein B0H11DRAFT_1923873 [Mycena galericulata]|nr:hypothetical protein B0H11DRAFT_1923873 [Mycena galericulata]